LSINLRYKVSNLVNTGSIFLSWLQGLSGLFLYFTTLSPSVGLFLLTLFKAIQEGLNTIPGEGGERWDSDVALLKFFG